jgi:xanthine dehydrogenase small subunit
MNPVTFILNGEIVRIEFDEKRITPTTTLLNYLRDLPNHKGVKEGCAEGDCGACTVVLAERTDTSTLRYRAVDSCLVFLPMVHGKQVVTVEDLKVQNQLHPVQQAMVETGGSQCGYCTPGFIMSMFALYKSQHQPSRLQIDDALTGNLCRCTGYRPIVEATAQSCVHGGNDHITANEAAVAGMLSAIPNESVHIKTVDQEYVRPKTLREAMEFKRKHPDAIVICGATDVALRVTKKHEVLGTILDLSSIDALKKITDDDATLRIGASATLSDMMPFAQKHFPALHDMLSVFGSLQIRNLATLGGNLGTASPIGDTLPVLMAYNATVALESIDGKREVSLDEFVVGYRKTVRKLNELITQIIIPKLMDGVSVRSYKISKRKDLDISTVSAGFRLELNGGKTIESVKLVYGGMADRTKRAEVTEKFLAGKTWTRSVVEEAMTVLENEFTPISDARGSAEFRRVVARNLLLKFWSENNGK